MYNAVLGPAPLSDVGQVPKQWLPDVAGLKAQLRTTHASIQAVIDSCADKVPANVMQQWVAFSTSVGEYIESPDPFWLWTTQEEYAKGQTFMAEEETWRVRLEKLGCSVPGPIKQPEKDKFDEVLDKALVVGAIVLGVWALSKFAK